MVPQPMGFYSTCILYIYIKCYTVLSNACLYLLQVGGLSYSLTNAVVTLVIGKQDPVSVWAPLILPVLLSVAVTVGVIRHERRQERAAGNSSVVVDAGGAINPHADSDIRPGSLNRPQYAEM